MKTSAKELTIMLENRLHKELSERELPLSNFEVRSFEKYRQQVVEQQLRNNISSVYWEQVIWKEEIIRFPVISSLLEPFPRDWKICARYKHKLTSKFLDFCQKWQFPIIEEFDICSKINQNYVDAKRVKEVANEYRWGLLVGENEYKYNPIFKKIIQSYRIVFTNLTDCNSHEDDEECISFTALHSWQIPVKYLIN